MKKVLLALAMLSLIGGASAQESNLAGGVMIAHAPVGLEYTSDAMDWCGIYAADPLTDSYDQINAIYADVAAARVWYVVAAFESDKIWCGSQFGLGDFDPVGGFYIGGYGPCLDGNLEIPGAGWPGPNAGTAVVATHTEWVGNYLPIYWFGGYCYGTSLLQLDVDPSQDPGFIGFGNCEAPSQVWTAAGGAMGIFTDGIAVHPEAQPDPQACCDEFGACVLLIPVDCEAGGGVVYPELTCDPNPCPVLVRACCFENGDCLVMMPDACEANAGVVYPELTCDPNPCPMPIRACCTDPDICTLTTEAECDGEWKPEELYCDPNPCVVATDDASWGSIKNQYR